MKLMYITNDPQIAAYAESCGVNRIFVDMEYLGKDDRQGHLDTHKAKHTISDIKIVKAAIKNAELLVRVNPIHAHSTSEILDAIQAGADVIMLPMFTRAEEVEEFIKIVNGNAKVSLLLETPKALVRLDEILQLSAKIDEIHIGLNDLHLGMNLDFMFELLSGGIVEFAATKIRKAKVKFGIGGIACVGMGAVPAELVLSEHVRLGSEMAILSRTFHSNAKNIEELKTNIDLQKELQSIFSVLTKLKQLGPDELLENERLFQQSVRDFTKRRFLNS